MFTLLSRIVVSKEHKLAVVLWRQYIMKYCIIGCRMYSGSNFPKIWKLLLQQMTTKPSTRLWKPPKGYTPSHKPTHQYGRPRSFTRQHCHPEVLFTSSHVLHVNNTAIDTRHMVALVHWRVRENKFLQSQGKVREFQFELAEFTSVIEVRKKCSFKEIGSLSSCPGSVPDSRWRYFPFMMSCHRISTT